MTALYNFAANLFTRNAQRGDKLAYIDDTGGLSYGQLEAQARGFAASLLASGARAEERLLLLAHDCCGWPVAFLGAQWAGLAPVCLNTLLTAEDYAYMLDHSRPRAAVVSAALLPVFVQALGLSAHCPATVWVIGADADALNSSEGSNNSDVSDNSELSKLTPHKQRFEDACAAAPLLQCHPTRGDDIGLWLYSSGSTGKPKGAAHCHTNLRETAQLYGQGVLGIHADDVCFSAAKLYFAYGLGNGLSFPLWAGATTVLTAQRPTPAVVFACWTRREHRPTVFFGAPTGYAGMLASADRPAPKDLALRLCSSAGEALPRDLGERFKATYGCDIVDGIGSTEMLHIFLSNTPDDVRYGTSGKPVTGYAVSLRRDDGSEAGVGEIGDLYIKGPSAALLYWADRPKSLATFQGEWTKSGDKYTVDEHGYYTYSGRSDDMLKVSGQYVSPFEVEGALQRHDAVLEAAVVGVDDDNGLTRAKAYVVLKAGYADSDVLLESIKTFVKAQLAPYKYPRIITVVAELPKTATGKIQRFRLRELG